MKALSIVVEQLLQEKRRGAPAPGSFMGMGRVPARNGNMIYCRVIFAVGLLFLAFPVLAAVETIQLRLQSPIGFRVVRSGTRSARGTGSRPLRRSNCRVPVFPGRRRAAAAITLKSSIAHHGSGARRCDSSREPGGSLPSIRWVQRQPA